MPGERSKLIGEVGENIAGKFFELIGWKSAQKGLDIPCLFKKEHAKGNAETSKAYSHGIDYQYSYRSSLESETVNNLLISVKHIKDTGYPQSATTKFKGYISDLANTVKCYQRSSHRQRVCSKHSGISNINEIAVLFYISSKDSVDTDYVNRIHNSRFINDHQLKELYIIDNKRVTFAYETINFINSSFTDYEWFFFHPLSGLNISDQDFVRHSRKIQIEFLASGFIPFILKKEINRKETCKFVVVSSDNFSGENLARFVTYCRNNTSDNIKDIEISFPDYFKDDHDNIVRDILSQNEISEEFDINVSNYNNNFRGLNNGYYLSITN